jgi:chromosome segregation ATPase
MATERWTDEMLDRLVTFVQANQQANETNWQQLSERMDTNLRQTSQSINELSRTQTQMMEEHREYRRDMTEMRAEMLEMQAEIRGLQTENRRILDRLFNNNNE